MRKQLFALNSREGLRRQVKNIKLMLLVVCTVYDVKQRLCAVLLLLLCDESSGVTLIITSSFHWPIAGHTKYDIRSLYIAHSQSPIFCLV